VSGVPAAVREFFATRAIAPCRVLLAVSGGVDSSALLLAFVALRADGWDLLAAHVNHHLRAEDSMRDETFVRELCVSQGVALHVVDGILDAERVRATGIEAAARAVRYERLLALREQTGARWLVTAHQKDDQAETVLMRLLSGSSLSGLRGIRAIRDDGVVRPLLDVTRAQLEELLAACRVTPRHDCSNDDPRFVRNRVRRIVRELGAVEPLAAAARQAAELWPVIDAAIDHAEREHLVVSPDETSFVSLPSGLWLRKALLHRHIRRLHPEARDVSANDLERLAAEMPELRRVSVTKELELVRRGAFTVLRRRAPADDGFEIALAPGRPAWIPALRSFIHIEPDVRKEDHASVTGQLLQLPPEALPDFTVRSRRPGDRLQPLGLAHSKKLKDLLIDRKIAAELRDRVPLLVWNGEIAWVAGVEISEKFKVTDPPGALFRVWLEGPLADDESDQPDLQRR
jgi:tRNA(Ile)-lysidine synthase